MDLRLRIDVRGDLELREFLTQRGIPWRPDAGVFCGPPPDMEQIGKIMEMLKSTPPYLIVSITTYLSFCALRDYAKAKQKRLKAEISFKGIKLDATNWTAEELNKVEILTMFKFEPEDQDAD